jgi:hypothetical protein
MHNARAEGNFKEGGKAVKPVIIEEYTTCVGYVDLSDRMANSCSTSKKTWKSMGKNPHLLDLTILNSYILYKSCEGDMTRLKFKERIEFAK